MEYLQDFNNSHIPLTNCHQLSMQQLSIQLSSSHHFTNITDKPIIDNNNNKPDTSQTTNNMITDQDVSVLHQPSHMTDSNASSVTNIADIINHMIDIQGSQETLDNSIHASRPKPIIKLPHNDLYHILNKIRNPHQTHTKSHFAFITVSTIPSITLIEKIDFVIQICKAIDDYNDYN